jgi:hypothetical protein
MSADGPEERAPPDQWMVHGHAQLHHDPDGPGTVGWPGMNRDARASACLATLLARHPLELGNLRFDPGKRLVFSAWADPNRPGRRSLVIGPLYREADALARLRSSVMGDRWPEVVRLLARR